MSSEMNTFQYDAREKRQSELKFLYIIWLWLERTGNYRRRGRESVLTPVPQGLFQLIIFPGERDIG